MIDKDQHNIKEHNNKINSYEALAVYKTAFDLCVYFEKIVKKFSKSNKYTIGADLKNKTRKITTQVIRANYSNRKTKDIEEIKLLVEELKMLVRLCQEISGFPNKNSYGYISKLLTALTNQSQCWLLCSQKREQTECNPEL